MSAGRPVPRRAAGRRDPQIRAARASRSGRLGV